MANVIPQQIYIRGNRVLTQYANDSLKSSEELERLISVVLGNSYQRINFKKRTRNIFGQYTKENGDKIFFIVANLTFMGGTEGQHPKDLKRIQYNVDWRDFYDRYSPLGRVLWLGLYSYRDTNIWAFFKPESYLQKHAGKAMVSKGGHKAMYSCHIYLNDLKIGYENGLINSYQKKTDKNKNLVGAIKYDCLRDYFEGRLEADNPVLTKIKEINENFIPWNRWIRADEAIPYMKSLIPITGFSKWKENMWNGWLVEGFYSDYLNRNPSEYIHYLATTRDLQVRGEYEGFCLDLAFPNPNDCFIGDLKAISEGDEDTYLNDESIVNKALKRFKKVWFVFYIHKKKKGCTNNYEMVKWRNHFIRDEGEWSPRKTFRELSAPRTPHSIYLNEMVIVELNNVTKDRYFTLRKQGRNSNGKARNQKYSLNKTVLRIINDDGFVRDRFVLP